MGSGLYAAAAEGAWIRNPRLGLTAPGDVSVFNGGAAPAAAYAGYDPDCYSLSNMLVGTDSVAFFRPGGPGGDGVGCNSCELARRPV
jgi:hypothetical protein